MPRKAKTTEPVPTSTLNRRMSKKELISTIIKKTKENNLFIKINLSLLTIFSQRSSFNNK